VIQPQLYQSYATEEIVSFFGSPDEAQRFCNGQWLIFPKTAICLANVSKWPEKSFFDNGSHFYWVADQPHFAPAHVLGPKAKERAIHLFASPPDSPEFLYVGELEPSYMSVAPGKGNYGMAMFALRPALPSALWVRFGGLPLGDLDFAPVDRALESLQRPTTVEDRLGVLQRLVEFWHGPIKPGDGMSDVELAGVPLPTPLRWWYRWAGKRTEIMSGQNILYRPVDKHWALTVEGSHLRFYCENQGCYFWSTLTQGDDPPVFGRYNSTDPWEQEDVTLSEHLILACLFEAVSCQAKYGASASLDKDTLSEITSRIPPVAIAPWRWEGSKFYAGRGAFMWATKFGYVQIGAKTEHPLQFLRPYIDDDWVYVAI
jgi:hypothetical protein